MQTAQTIAQSPFNAHARMRTLLTPTSLVRSWGTAGVTGGCRGGGGIAAAAAGWGARQERRRWEPGWCLWQGELMRTGAQGARGTGTAAFVGHCANFLCGS